jgi:hypothetical protein
VSGVEMVAMLASSRCGVLLAASMATLSCGRSATDPSIALALNPGLYSFTTSTTGGGVSCVVTGQAPPSTLSFPSVPEQSGPDWTFRIRDQPSATFELRVGAFAGTPGAWKVNGFILGDAAIASTPPVSVTFGKLGIIAATSGLDRIDGVIHGQVQFADGLGNLLTCIEVPWSVVRIGNVPQ